MHRSMQEMTVRMFVPTKIQTNKKPSNSKEEAEGHPVNLFWLD